MAFKIRPQQTVIEKSIPWDLPFRDGEVIEQTLGSARLTPGMILDGVPIESIEQRTDADGFVLTLLDEGRTTNVYRSRDLLTVGVRISCTTASGIHDGDMLVRVFDGEVSIDEVVTAVRLAPPVTTQSGTLVVLVTGERLFFHDGAGACIVNFDRDADEATHFCEDCGHSAWEHEEGAWGASCEVHNCSCVCWSPGHPDC